MYDYICEDCEFFTISNINARAHILMTGHEVVQEFNGNDNADS